MSNDIKDFTKDFIVSAMTNAMELSSVPDTAPEIDKEFDEKQESNLVGNIITEMTRLTANLQVNLRNMLIDNHQLSAYIVSPIEIQFERKTNDQDLSKFDKPVKIIYKGLDNFGMTSDILNNETSSFESCKNQLQLQPNDINQTQSFEKQKVDKTLTFSKRVRKFFRIP